MMVELQKIKSENGGGVVEINNENDSAFEKNIHKK